MRLLCLLWPSAARAAFDTAQAREAGPTKRIHARSPYRNPFDPRNPWSVGLAISPSRPKGRRPACQPKARRRLEVAPPHLPLMVASPRLGFCAVGRLTPRPQSPQRRGMDFPLRPSRPLREAIDLRLPASDIHCPTRAGNGRRRGRPTTFVALRLGCEKKTPARAGGYPE